MRPGDLVLVKGSRGIRTELVVERLDGGVRLMLYHLLYPFHTQISALNVTRYITFRTARGEPDGAGDQPGCSGPG